MKKIKELEKKVEEARKVLLKASEELVDAQNKILLPEAIKQFEGKYFKTKNSYGGDSEDWWKYKQIIKVHSHTHCTWVSFEKTSTNELKIEEEDFAWLSTLSAEDEITFQEWEKALKKFQKDIIKTLK